LYDSSNRLAAVIENDIGGMPSRNSNILTRYVYDALGYRTAITNALGYTDTHTIYDALNRPVVVEDALGHKTAIHYNALGYRTIITDADSDVTRYSYDGFNRLIEVYYEADDITVEYEYDAVGNCTAMTDTLGVTRYVYDDLYRLVSVSDPITGTVSYAYDLAGNRTQLVYPDGKVVTYTYDADNRLIQVDDWDKGLTRYAYDAVGRLTSATLPNGMTTTYQYDAANRLTKLSHTATDNTLLSSYSYELDGVGNRVQAVEALTETTRTITYTYDDLYRLIKADYSTGENFQYAYDAVGNRSTYTATITQTTVTDYQYDAANRLVNAGDVVYTWSDTGRLLNDDAYQYTWNAAGRLITITDGVNTLGFRYDGNGNRRVRIANGILTTHTLDIGFGLPEVLMEYGTDVTRYLHLPHGIVTQDGGGWSYGAADGLGSVRQRLDGSGQVIATQDYQPFGSPLSGNGNAPYGFTGEWWEGQTGLLFLRARYYNPETGTFLSADPVPGNHLYGYVGSNPINLIDPSGKDGTPPPPTSVPTPQPRPTPPPPPTGTPTPNDLKDGSGGLQAYVFERLLDMPAGLAVMLTKSVYAKDGLARICLFQDPWQRSSDTVDDLVTDYICEFGPRHRIFYGDDHLTQQLARSLTVHLLREQFYREGEGRYLKGQKAFDTSEFLVATLDSLMEGDSTRYPFGPVAIPINITHFLGTFDYRIERVGERVHYKIHNQTDLASGSRIPPLMGGVPVERDEEGISVEDVLEVGPWDWHSRPLWSIVDEFPIISILRPKTRDETGGFLDLEGGGTMEQTFFWKEQFFGCDLPPWPAIRSVLEISGDMYWMGPPDTFPWSDEWSNE
jgi:RHS repeat-associated protein